MYIIDGRNLKLEGMISTGSFAQTTLAPDRSEIYAVITYFTKVNRGERAVRRAAERERRRALGARRRVPPAVSAAPVSQRRVTPRRLHRSWTAGRGVRSAVRGADDERGD